MHKISFLAKGRVTFSNADKYSWQDHALAFILRQVTFYDVNYRIPIRLVAEPAIEAVLRDGKGGMIYTVHTKVKSIFPRLFEDLGLKFSSVRSSDTVGKRWAERLRLKSKPNVILKNNDTLLAVRGHISRGEIVVIGVDYVKRKVGAAPELCISPSSFVFAKKLELRCFFAVPVISDSGELLVIVEEPPIGSVENVIDAFTNFIERHTGVAKSWRVSVEGQD